MTDSSILQGIWRDQFAIVSIDAYTEARPYPYDTTVNLAVADGGAPDTFAAGYALTFPIGTYDFGDVPNYVHISMVVLEDIPANDTYIIEFYESPNGVDFQPIGAIRFVRVAPFTPTAYLALPLRPVNNDVNGVYARLKSAIGGNTVTYSVEIKRWFPPSGARLQSAGVWPFG